PSQGFSLALEPSREKLTAALALLTEILREPSYPADQLEIVRKETQTALTAALQQPSELAVSALARHLRAYPPDDPRYVPSLVEQLSRLASVQPSDLARLHRELFGAPEVTLALVGDFDPSAVTEQLGAALSTFRAQTTFQRLPTPYQPHTGAVEQIQVPDKPGAFVILGQNLELSQRDPDYAAVQLFQFMLGGHENARLNTHLRERAGIAYSVETLVQCGLDERSGLFVVYFTAAPQNAQPGLQLLERELVDFLQNGPSPAELQAAQKTYRQHLEAALADDATLAAELAGLRQRDLTLTFLQDHLSRVAALNSRELLIAARRHIDPARLIKVLAGSWPAR
ncbi:MAG TPA: insulinase family protein, partial [Pseudomonadota bacterium]|nr:insulinase family protein [Pseudomonadota bacterium]